MRNLVSCLILSFLMSCSKEQSGLDVITYCGAEICSVTDNQAGDQKLRTGLMDGDKAVVFYSDHNSSFNLVMKAFKGNAEIQKRLNLDFEFYPLGSSMEAGDYVICGYTMLDGKQRATVLLIDPNGNLEKSYMMPDSFNSSFNAVEAAEFIYLAGWVDRNGIRTNSQVTLNFRLEEVGIVEPQTDEASAYTDILWDNGAIYLLGHEYRAGDRDIKLSYTVIDSIYWTKYYGSDAYEEAHDIELVNEDYIAIAAHSAKEDPLHQAYCLLVDWQGEILWEKHIGGEEHDGAEAVLWLQKGELCFVVRSESFSGDSDVHLIKLNSFGEQLNEEVIIEEGINEAYDILEAPDHLLLLGKHLQGNQENVHLIRVPK